MLVRIDPTRERTVTYGYIAKVLGRHHRGMRMPLAKIQDECNDRGWPTITALVVRADSGVPGQGCDAADPRVFNATLREVAKTPWPPVAWW